MYEEGTDEYKRITEELKKLQVSPADLDFDFGSHAKRFRNLPGAVAMKAQSDRGREEWICGPDDEDNLDQSAPNYCNLVKMAAVACGYTNNEDGVQAWHMLLERDSPLCKEWNLTNPREASARQCENLQLKFYAMKRERKAHVTNWRLLELRFRELKSKKSAEKLLAEYNIHGFNEPLWAESQWALRNTYELHSEFQTIAKLAATIAGRGDTWQDWLDLLRSEKYGYERSTTSLLYSNEDDAGEIRKPCDESERFCRDRADTAGEPLLEENTKAGEEKQSPNRNNNSQIIEPLAQPPTEIPKNKSRQQGGNMRRGRPSKNGPIIKALHRWDIRTYKDMSDPKSLRNSFAMLDGKEDIPGYVGDKDWMSLIDNPERQYMLNSVKSALDKALKRSGHN
jgi:hypothetical protein